MLSKFSKKAHIVFMKKTKVKNKRKQRQKQKQEIIPPAMDAILKSTFLFSFSILNFLQLIQGNKYLWNVAVCWALRVERNKTEALFCRNSYRTKQGSVRSQRVAETIPSWEEFEEDKNAPVWCLGDP